MGKATLRQSHKRLRAMWNWRDSQLEDSRVTGYERARLAREKDAIGHALTVIAPMLEGDGYVPPSETEIEEFVDSQIPMMIKDANIAADNIQAFIREVVGYGPIRAEPSSEPSSEVL